MIVMAMVDDCHMWKLPALRSSQISFPAYQITNTQFLLTFAFLKARYPISHYPTVSNTEGKPKTYIPIT